MNLNDDAVVVATAKIGGLLDISNEMLSDASINVTAQITTVIRDSLSKQLDQGLLFGEGPPEPQGIVATADEASRRRPARSGAHRARVDQRRGRRRDDPGRVRGDAGRRRRAARRHRRADVPNGFAAVTGLTHVTVPELAVPLVYARTRLHLVLRDDPIVEVSTDFRWDYDAASVRVKARMAAGCPDPDKSLRKLSVGDDSTRRGAEPKARPAKS